LIHCLSPLLVIPRVSRKSRHALRHERHEVTWPAIKSSFIAYKRDKRPQIAQDPDSLLIQPTRLVTPGQTRSCGHNHLSSHYTTDVSVQPEETLPKPNRTVKIIFFMLCFMSSPRITGIPALSIRISLRHGQRTAFLRIWHSAIKLAFDGPPYNGTNLKAHQSNLRPAGEGGLRRQFLVIDHNTWAREAISTG